MFSKLKNFITKFKKMIIIAIFGGTALASGLSGIPQDLYNNLNVKVYSVCDLQTTKRTSIANDLTNFKARNPDNSLRELNAGERASFKSCEIAKRGTEFAGIYDSAQYSTRIEIIGEVKAIEINGQNGIELFARAWKGGKQLGFGTDGSVEIERFRIFNPPILIPDSNRITGEKTQIKYKEDLVEAIKINVARIISKVGKENQNIIIGKIGNTTTAVLSDGDAEIQKNDSSSWATTHDATTASVRTTSGNSYIQVDFPDGGCGGPTNYLIRRAFTFFDTSGLPDTDNIDSAQILLQSSIDPKSGSGILINVYNSTHSDPVVGDDFELIGTTAQATAIAVANWSGVAGTDNTFTLNATGISNISKTAKTKFGYREVTYDIGNVQPSASCQYFGFYDSTKTGTTNDPELVVEHSGAAATGEEYQILFE